MRAFTVAAVQIAPSPAPLTPATVASTTSVGGASSGKRRIASFSFQSRSARGLFTTRVPSASARSRSSVA